jgi:hypothetical protein
MELQAGIRRTHLLGPELGGDDLLRHQSIEPLVTAIRNVSVRVEDARSPSLF